MDGNVKKCVDCLDRQRSDTCSNTHTKIKIGIAKADGSGLFYISETERPRRAEHVLLVIDKARRRSAFGSIGQSTASELFRDGLTR